MSATALRMDDWWLAGIDATGLMKVSEEKDASGAIRVRGVVTDEGEMRADVVNDGASVDDILKNAPAAEDHFFLVPKVVE